MGIVNVTPDSFSDGGRLTGMGATVAHAERLVAAGAGWLDLGGESTRPGAAPLGEAEEIDRVLPVLETLRARLDIPLSIDTMKPAVAAAAIAAGARMWNDVTALAWSPRSEGIAGELGCEVVLMHMRGEPATMQDDPRYEDVAAEVIAHLTIRAHAAMAAGVARENIWLDPGIGFGKTAAHNLALIGALDRIVALGFRVLVGASRKGFIRAVDLSAVTPLDRLGASIALAIAAGRQGVDMVRAHDVRETVQALAMTAAIDAGRVGA